MWYSSGGQGGTGKERSRGARSAYSGDAVIDSQEAPGALCGTQAELANLLAPVLSKASL